MGAVADHSHAPLAGESGESQQPRLVILQPPFSVEKLYAAVDRCLGRT
ncbi:MAG TPA: hypothetical protein VFQ30_01945 [Ktedonobacteraceae bacterium]|nr:hypothetical protein [Ktedonobacteraceae bacterium]